MNEIKHEHVDTSDGESSPTWEAWILSTSFQNKNVSEHNYRGSQWSANLVIQEANLSTAAQTENMLIAHRINSVIPGIINHIAGKQLFLKKLSAWAIIMPACPHIFASQLSCCKASASVLLLSNPSWQLLFLIDYSKNVLERMDMTKEQSPKQPNMEL